MTQAPPPPPPALLLEVRGLSVSFAAADGRPVRVVDDVALSLRAGEALALVGESGAGKSTAAAAALGLPPTGATVTADRLAFDGVDLRGLSPAARRRAVAGGMAAVFQDGDGGLDPCFTVGFQLAESLRLRRPGLRGAALRARAADLLAEVGIAEPQRRLSAYPHQLSGGMRRRVAVALALATEPRLLAADEPTAGLDVLIRRQIIDLLRRLRVERNFALLLITHDAATAAELTDRRLEMRAGRIIESLPSVAAAPVIRTTPAAATPGAPAVLELTDIRKDFTVSRGLLRRPARLRAVDGVSLALPAGRTLAVVGESGCGKTTLARCAALIETADAGTVLYDGKNPRRDKSLRPFVQMVFQDPFASLNPRKTVAAALAEPLTINTRLGRAEMRTAAAAMLARVGLDGGCLDRYPHMLSGGQQQRVAVARALMLRPKAVIADEPVSALDPATQTRILDLMSELQETFGVAWLFIAHDLDVVRRIADTVAVMYFGRVVEIAARNAFFAAPRHPYAQALTAARPSATGAGTVWGGEPPSPLAPPGGCACHPCCPRADARCRSERPELRMLDGGRVACHHAER